MQIYNSNRLDSNTRFLLAILAGLAAALVGGFLYGAVYSFLRIESAVLYIFIGWCIGTVIRKVGRGVHARFSVLGAIMTILAILFGDLIATWGIEVLIGNFGSPEFWSVAARYWLAGLFSTNIYSLLGLVLRTAGVYFGFHYSVVL